MRSPLKLKLGSPLRTWGVLALFTLMLGALMRDRYRNSPARWSSFLGRRSTRGRYTVLRNEGLRALSRCQWGRGQLGA
jgi:hypothetical protein